MSGVAEYSRTTQPTDCCTYGSGSSASLSMNTSSPARAGGGTAPGATVSGIGCVRWLPTYSAGTVITPSRRGRSATAYSVRATLRPLLIVNSRRLVWPLRKKSDSSGA